MSADVQGWVEARITPAEQKLEWILRWINQWTPLIKQALQNARTASATYGGGGGGSGGGVFFYAGGSVIPAATGLPGTGTPGGPVTGQTVYQIASGAFGVFSSSASIYNGLMSATAAGKGHVVAQNPDGTFCVVAESCT